MVKVNGESMAADGKSVTALLEMLKFQAGRVAVELNGEIVPSDRYGETLLKDGDTAEVVRFVGGG